MIGSSSHFSTMPQSQKKKTCHLKHKLRHATYAYEKGTSYMAVAMYVDCETKMLSICGNKAFSSYMARLLKSHEREMTALFRLNMNQAMRPEKASKKSKRIADDDLIELDPDSMSVEQLRHRIPMLVLKTTGRGRPHWDDEGKRVPWWPVALPFKSPRQDWRDVDDRPQPFVEILREIAKNFKKWLSAQNLKIPATIDDCDDDTDTDTDDDDDDDDDDEDDDDDDAVCTSSKAESKPTLLHTAKKIKLEPTESKTKNSSMKAQTQIQTRLPKTATPAIPKGAFRTWNTVVPKTQRRSRRDLSPGPWVPRLGLKETDKFAGKSSWLTDKHIYAAQTLLREQFVHIEGLKDTILGQKKFSPLKMVSRGVQILNANNAHWLCIATDPHKPNEAEVYDSMVSGRYYLLESVVRLICQLLDSSESRIKLNVMDIKQQRGGCDCGLFAIAVADMLCRGVNPCTADLQQSKMREHLAACFEAHKMNEFPTSQARRKPKKPPPVHNVDIICLCRQPQGSGTVIECGRCKEWFHKDCVSAPEKAFKRKTHKWFCVKCQC